MKKDLRQTVEWLSLALGAFCCLAFIFFRLFTISSTEKDGLRVTYFQTDLLVLEMLFFTVTFFKTDGRRILYRMLSLLGSIALLINEIMLWLTKNQWDAFFTVIMVINILGFFLLLLSQLQKRFRLARGHILWEMAAIPLLLAAMVLAVIYGTRDMLYIVILNWLGIALLSLNVLECLIQTDEQLHHTGRRKRDENQ